MLVLNHAVSVGFYCRYSMVRDACNKLTLVLICHILLKQNHLNFPLINLLINRDWICSNPA